MCMFGGSEIYTYIQTLAPEKSNSQIKKGNRMGYTRSLDARKIVPSPVRSFPRGGEMGVALEKPYFILARSLKKISGL